MADQDLNWCACGRQTLDGALFCSLRCHDNEISCTRHDRHTASIPSETPIFTVDDFRSGRWKSEQERKELNQPTHSNYYSAFGSLPPSLVHARSPSLSSLGSPDLESVAEEAIVFRQLAFTSRKQQWLSNEYGRPTYSV
ncbi:hypothetical protein HDU98_011163 [Podochytrium sp. JEL0797]|nr:hypothetical protein HDU98_011163 [Podochytrium sp. JEL0797]